MNPTNSADFFLVALPGLEDLVLAELKNWHPEIDAKAVHGGVELQTSLSQGLALNMILKTPTRILLRVERFRCRDFPKLYQKIRDFSWEHWIDEQVHLEVDAAVHASRLKIKKRIEETCQKAWVRRQKERGVKPFAQSLRLFVRLVRDECTLSLDTSGERLHKRGQRTRVGEAPLRETIAAALLQWSVSFLPAGRQLELVDPMMGSGVFLLEAHELWQPVDSRDFAFSLFKATVNQSAEKPFASPFARFVGFEADAKTVITSRYL